jgi:hypothetical protein
LDAVRGRKKGTDVIIADFGWLTNFTKLYKYVRFLKNYLTTHFCGMTEMQKIICREPSNFGHYCFDVYPTQLSTFGRGGNVSFARLVKMLSTYFSWMALQG